MGSIGESTGRENCT